MTEVRTDTIEDGEVAKDQQPPKTIKSRLDATKSLVQDNAMLWVKVVVFKTGTYVFDIFSDIANGVDYLRGTRLPSDSDRDPTVCDKLKSYSHPKWGGLTIALTWLPGLLYVVGQGAFKYSQGKLTWKMALGYAALALVWPFLMFGLLLSGLFPNSKKRKFTFCGDVWDYEHALAFKAQEGFLEAAPQMVLQFCLLAQGINLGPLQIFALCVSFITLNMTSSEWNYYWFDLHQPTSFVQMLVRAIKVTPFFLLPIVYKTISWAILVSLLSYYSIIVLVLALVYQYAIQKRTGFLPQHITRGIFYNLCTIARPAAHSTWNSKMAGMFRLDTYGSLFVHLVALCVATSVWDIVPGGEISFCTFDWVKSNISVIGRGVMVLGVLNAVVAETYLTFFPHLVLPTMEQEAVEMTDKKLGWGAERVNFKENAKGSIDATNAGQEEATQDVEHATSLTAKRDEVTWNMALPPGKLITATAGDDIHTLGDNKKVELGANEDKLEGQHDISLRNPTVVVIPPPPPTGVDHTLNFRLWYESTSDSEAVSKIAPDETDEDKAENVIEETEKATFSNEANEDETVLEHVAASSDGHIAEVESLSDAKLSESSPLHGMQRLNRAVFLCARVEIYDS